VKCAVVLESAPVRAIGLTAAAVGLEWARVLVLRSPDWQVPVLLAGGAALCLLGLGWSPAAEPPWLRRVRPLSLPIRKRQHWTNTSARWSS